MGFFDKVGDAFEATGGAIGAAWTFANEKDPLQAMGFEGASEAVRDVAKPVSAPLRWVGSTAWDGASGGFAEAARLAGTPFKYVGRGISTGVQVVGTANSNAHGQLIFSQDQWEKAWDRSETISPGQAFMTNVASAVNEDGSPIQGATGDFVPDVADPFTENQSKDRHDYFYNTPAGRLSSGSIDFWLNLTADPVGLAGDGIIKANQAATRITKGNQADVLKTVRGEQASSSLKGKAAKRSDANAEMFKNMLAQTDNLSAAEMANLPQFRETSDSGILAYFFEKANRMYPEAADVEARHQMKADIFGVALGDSGAIDAVKGLDMDLAEELKRAGSTVVQADAVDAFRWDDNGQGMLQLFNDPAQINRADELKNNAIERERARLQRLLELDSGTGKVGATLGERIGSQYRNNRLNETLIPQGMFGRPVRVVVGGTTARVPGFVNVKDQNKGYRDVQAVVQGMRYTPVADKKKYLADFQKAANDGDRRVVVDAIEARIFEDAAKHYGVKPAAAKQMLKDIGGRRGAYMESLRTRLYSTQGDAKYVSHVDPEDDIEDVFDKPLLQTQIEAATPVTDPQILHKTLERGTNRRLLEAWAEGRMEALQGVDGSQAATAAGRSRLRAKEFSATTMGFLDEAAMMITRPWKDMMLMRGAYPLRIQIDSQMRLGAHMGMLNYLMEARQAGTGLAKYALAVGEDRLTKQGKALEWMAKPVKYKGQDNIQPALDAGAAGRLWQPTESTGGSMADIGNDVQSEIVRGYRATGDFGRISTSDQHWFGHWKRAVNQVQGSPTARQALVTPDVDALREWMKTSSAGRQEWANFSKNGKTLETWLNEVSNHANNLLPTGDLKRFALKRDALQTLRADESFVKAEGRLRDAADRARSAQQTSSSYKEKLETAKLDVRKALDEKQRIEKMRVRGPNAVTTAADKKAALEAAKADLTAARQARLKVRHNKSEAVLKLKSERASVRDTRFAVDEAKQRAGLKGKPLVEWEGDIKTWNDVGKFWRNTDNLDQFGMDVHGEVYNPLSTSSSKLLQNLSKARNEYYRIVADLPETVIARAPLYSFTYKRYMRDAIDRIDGGTIDAERLERIRTGAHKAAVKEISNVLYDSGDVSNLAHNMRFLAPFFSAWEDSTKKWGKLIAKNPKIGANLSKAYFAPNEAGLVVDSEGNQIDQWGNLVDPETGEIQKKPKDYKGKGEYIVIPKALVPDGLGVGHFTVNKSSANILFQGEPPWLPGMGPLVQVPTNEISKRMFPDKVEGNPLLEYILPFGTQDSTGGLFPAWTKQVRNAFGGTKDHAATYTMLMAQEQTKFENGERSKAPTEKEIMNATRNWFILRASIGFGSPVSMMPRPEYQMYIDKAHQYKAKYKDQWSEKFYEDFPQYFKMSVSLSKNETGLQATPKVYEALKDNRIREAISGDPEFGWFFVGADANTGEFDPNIYQWMQENNASAGKKFLAKKTPDEALEDAEVSTGWRQYDKAMRFFELERDKRGLYSFQLAGAEDLAEAKATFIQDLARQNRSWFYAYSERNTSTVQKLVDVAQKNWQKNPKFAERSDQVALRRYLQGREYFTQALQARAVTGLDNPQNADLQQAWGNFVSDLKTSSPNFEYMYNRVLDGDQISQELL